MPLEPLRHPKDRTAVTIVADSISPLNVRLVTLLATYPRFIHSELMTHRVFSRNAASSRAIPARKNIDAVLKKAAQPHPWYMNTPGMESRVEATPRDVTEGITEWLLSAGHAAMHASRLEALGFHKSIVNRPLEPYLYMTTLISATEWENFLGLRDSNLAQPEFHLLAGVIRLKLNEHAPSPVKYGEWHIPFSDKLDLPFHEKLRVATARAARLSYLSFDGTISLERDFELHDKLLADFHMSPLEHSAQAMQSTGFFGNFRSWKQYRKEFEPDTVSHPEFKLWTYKEVGGL